MHLNHCSRSRTNKWTDIKDDSASDLEKIVKIFKKCVIDEVNDRNEKEAFRELMDDLRFDSPERPYVLAMINSRPIPDMMYC